jgi:predicted aspartyl protease
LTKAIVVAAMLIASSPGRAATPTSAAALMKHAMAALEAARPTSEIVEWTIVAGGLRGTQREVRRGTDLIETTVLGPFTTLRGSIAGKAWHQDENGTTVLDEPEPAAGATPAPALRLTRVTRPRDLWLVTAQLPAGGVRKTYYDPADLTIVREEVERGTHSAHVDYTDFRPWNGGRRRAWRASGGDDRGNAFVQTIVRDDVAPAIDDAAFAIPPNRRTLVEFPSDVNQVTLPATVEGGRIHVRVDVDGNPLTFVLDTGASGIVLDAQAAKDIKLPSYGSSALTVAGTFASTRVIAPMVRVGSLVMRDVVMQTAPIDAREGTTRVDGLLGFDFIAGAVLRIDYIDPGSVTAIRPSIFTPPLLATSAMPIRLSRQVPVVSVGIGTATSDDMIVDTGAQAPVLLFDRFVKAHPDAVADRGFAAPFDPAQNIVDGVGGRVPIVPLRIASVRFADLEFRNYLVLRARDAGAFGDVADDGLLGSLFLRFYTLYVDYPGRTLYFEPNENYTRGVGHPLEP